VNEDAFDRIARRLTAGASRRSAVGGVLGGVVALLTSAVGLEAQGQGNGLALGRDTGGAAAGRGRGPTASGADVDTTEDSEVGDVGEVEVELAQSKVSICHKGRVITVGAPAVDAHLREHDDGRCTNACQAYAKGGTCEASNGVAECACSDEILTTDVVEGEQTDAVEGQQRGKPRNSKHAKRAKQRARLEARRAAKQAR
jgi:hypothetical protein